MAEPGTLIFRNNTCVKKSEKKNYIEKNSIRTSEKDVRPFSKYKAHISKYVRHIFGRLKTRMNKGFFGTCKMQTKTVGHKNTFPKPCM